MHPSSFIREKRRSRCVAVRVVACCDSIALAHGQFNGWPQNRPFVCGQFCEGNSFGHADLVSVNLVAIVMSSADANFRVHGLGASMRIAVFSDELAQTEVEAVP